MKMLYLKIWKDINNDSSEITIDEKDYLEKEIHYILKNNGFDYEISDDEELVEHKLSEEDFYGDFPKECLNVCSR